ncbi:TLD-domain-containing protein [Xylariomycetidae sp. FL2044]|nr:TLD-domain-containing protein [Xylariomycetidae sp. FL2044]
MNRHHSENLIDLDDSPPPSDISHPILAQPKPEPSSPPRPQRRSIQHPRTEPLPATHSQSQPLSSASSQQKPPSPPQPQEHSTHHAAGYGIGSAVRGIWRRLSALEHAIPPPTTPLPQSQLYNMNSSLPIGSTAIGDGINGAFTPPRRAASPRGLPSLEPLILRGYRADTDPEEQLLSRGIAEEIRTFLPERLKIMEDWKLVYSLYQNGSSLSTLYQLCEEYRGQRVGFVLVVRDGKEGTFGAYLTEAPHPAPSYFGTGECFLWRATLHAPLPPPPSADTADLNFRNITIASPTSPTSASSSSKTNSHLSPAPTDPTTNKLAPTPPSATQSVRFQNFAYSGANDYCMFCETGFLSVGGGSGGNFGLWLNDSLSRGHSGTCDTFVNQPLSDEGEKFDVLGVELWVVGAT